MANQTIEGTSQEKRLYDLIWKRTAASQMADALLEKTTVDIAVKWNSGSMEAQPSTFIATGEVVKFDGFLKAYRESAGDDDTEQKEDGGMLPQGMKEGMTVERKEITATERYSQGPARYNEQCLDHYTQ